MSTRRPEKEDKTLIVSNRKARFHYDILETCEAGIELKGPEVKSLRARQASLDGSFARADKGQIFLHHMHIAPYAGNTLEPLDPLRTRRLLLTRKEIRKLEGHLLTKGLALVPLEAYFKRGWAKVILALAKGRRGPDKREAIKKRELARDMEQNFKGRFKV